MVSGVGVKVIVGVGALVGMFVVEGVKEGIAFGEGVVFSDSGFCEIQELIVSRDKTSMMKYFFIFTYFLKND